MSLFIVLTSARVHYFTTVSDGNTISRNGACAVQVGRVQTYFYNNSIPSLPQTVYIETGCGVKYKIGIAMGRVEGKVILARHNGRSSKALQTVCAKIHDL